MTTTDTTATHTAARGSTAQRSAAQRSAAPTLLTPSEAGRAREIIESALRDYHACSACGEPMGIAEHGGKIWVECASLHTRTGLRHALGAAFHERHRLWLPTGELAAAA